MSKVGDEYRFKPYIEEFLFANDFRRTDEEMRYTNDKCKVKIIINDDIHNMSAYYLVSRKLMKYDDDYGSMYSDDLNIYWLIGVLTYNNLMDKDYVTV